MQGAQLWTRHYTASLKKGSCGLKKLNHRLVSISSQNLDALPDLIVGVQAGGIFVDKNARSFFEERFAQVDSLSSSERTQYVNDGVEDFINKAKNDFDDTDYEVIVRVGGPKEDFDEIEVDSGDMTISS